MESEVKRGYIRDALACITQALRSSIYSTRWRRYNVAETHAKRGGVDIHIARESNTCPPYALAKGYLEVVLTCMAQKGDT